VSESLLDSLAGFCTAEKNAYLVFCLKLAYFVANNVVINGFIGLVSDQYNLHTLFPVFSYLLEPVVLYAFKGFVVVKIE
jgi:hypothetical protein